MTTPLIWQADVIQLTPSPDPKTAAWLQHPDKLSPLLKRCNQQLAVDLLLQTLINIHPEEASYLKIEPEVTALVREVFLQGDTERWCFARTVVPPATYQAYQSAFDHLGTQLLGETIIYAGPYVRSPFEFAYIAADSWLQQRLTHYHITTPLWARRSLFGLGVKQLPLSLIEVFLPGIPVTK
jgi:chorismate lyase